MVKNAVSLILIASMVASPSSLVLARQTAKPTTPATPTPTTKPTTPAPTTNADDDAGDTGSSRRNYSSR